MTTSIFIRTYAGDAAWLHYCLRSIAKFCHGFYELSIVCPTHDWNTINRVINEVRDSRLPSLSLHSCVQRPQEDGYMHQQTTKMLAHYYSTGDNIMFVDSDCVFERETTPELLCPTGKPDLLVTPYAQLGNSVPWKPITEKALGFECEFETMRRLPITVPSTALAEVEAYMRAKWNVNDVGAYIMRQPGREFSEFNVIGSYILKHMPNAVRVVDTTRCQIPEPIVLQSWSWGGITPDIRLIIEEILK